MTLPPNSVPPGRGNRLLVAASALTSPGAVERNRAREERFV